MLEGLRDVDQGLAFFARGEGGGHPVDDHIGAAARDHLFGRDVGPAWLDGDVEPLVLVEALVLGDVIARELGLRHPFELQRHLVVRGLRGARGQERRDAREHE